MAHSIAVAEATDKSAVMPQELLGKSDAWEPSGRFGETDRARDGHILYGRQEIDTRPNRIERS